MVVLLLDVVGLVGAEPDKWGKSAVFIKGKWTQFDENDEAGVPQPYPPRTDSWMQNDTSIMVSISSFRDYRCPKTLYNLFTYVSRVRGRGRDVFVLYDDKNVHKLVYLCTVTALVANQGQGCAWTF